MNDMQKELYQIYSRLGTIEGIVKRIETDAKEERIENKKDNDNRDGRLGKLEGRQNWAAGASFILGGIATYLCSILRSSG